MKSTWRLGNLGVASPPRVNHTRRRIYRSRRGKEKKTSKFTTYEMYGDNQILSHS